MSLLTNALINFAVFAALAFGGGLGTAWYMIEAGSRLSTRTFGPWTSWTAAGRPEADPYTRAHTARNGLLPVSSTLELTFRAKTDSNGSRLTSACDYTIVLPSTEAAWWSLAVFDGQGRLVQNGAERHAFNPQTAMREPDGRVAIAVARDARAGNWLPSGRSSRIVLVFTVQDAALAATVHDGGQTKALPEIQRAGCR
ncbi:MAG: DUF1214 domain-containing protein [Hyphomonadaceae bacterium]|nr:DUF1214 domain-containing protein [Hyphomonadaceae bacterium]